MNTTPLTIAQQAKHLPIQSRCLWFFWVDVRDLDFRRGTKELTEMVYANLHPIGVLQAKLGILICYSQALEIQSPFCHIGIDYPDERGEANAFPERSATYLQTILARLHDAKVASVCR